MVLADTPRTDNVVATVTAGAAVDELLARRLSDLTVSIGLALVTINGVGTNFEVRVRRGEARRADSGEMGFLRRGQPAPPHQGVCGSFVSSLSGVRGGSPAAEGFLVLSRQIAFPSISVRVAYSLHG